MKLEVNDPAVAQALEKALGHAPPFMAVECAAFAGMLVIEHARDLSALAHFPALRYLEVTASDVTTLDWLAHLPQLESLAIYACPVVDLEPLRHCAGLRAVTLVGTLATDAAPLFARPQLEQGTVLGQAWDEVSYEQFAAATAPLWEYDRHLNWQFNRLLHHYGVPGRLVMLDGWRRAIVRPGVPQYCAGHSDFIRDEEYAVELLIQELQNAPDIGPQVFDSLFNLVSEVERTRPQRQFDWHSHRELGRAETVYQWLGLVPQRIRSHLESLLQRFPEAVFYREKPGAWTGWEEVSRRAWPDWFVAERQLLAGLYAAEQLPVQFDETFADRIGGNFAYVIEPMLERLPSAKRFVPLPVARSVDSPSVLVVNAGEPNKPRLYEGQWSAEQIDPAEFRPVVGSYAELLGHIAAALPPQDQIND